MLYSPRISPSRHIAGRLDRHHGSICLPAKIVKNSIAKELGDLKNARDIDKNRRQRIPYYGY